MKKVLSIMLSVAMLFSVTVFAESGTASAQSDTEVYTELIKVDFDDVATASRLQNTDTSTVASDTATADFAEAYGTDVKIMSSNWAQFYYSIIEKTEDSTDKYIEMDGTNKSAQTAIQITIPNGGFKPNSGTYKISYDVMNVTDGYGSSFLRVKTDHTDPAETATTYSGTSGIYRKAPCLNVMGAIKDVGTDEESFYHASKNFYGSYSTFVYDSNYTNESSWDITTSYDKENKVNLGRDKWHTVDIKIDTINKKAHYYYNDAYVGTQSGDTFADYWICGDTYNAKSIQLQVTNNFAANDAIALDNITISHSESEAADPSTVTALDDTGLSFAGPIRYVTEKPISKLPVTYEAWLKFPEGYNRANSAASILSNYHYKSGVDSFNFQLRNWGQVKLHWEDPDYGDSGTGANYELNDVDVVEYHGNYQWAHIALVVDAVNNQAILYFNGEVRQTITIDGSIWPSSANYTTPFVLGDNWRLDDDWFDGSIREVLLYDDVRTADEVKADYENVDVDRDGLIAGWQPKLNEDGSEPERIEDISGGGVHFYKGREFIDEAPVDDYAYSFVVIGDTQNLNCFHGMNMINMYDEIMGLVGKCNTKFVFGLGDITNNDSDGEYWRTKACLAALDNLVPYSIVRGNHDSEEKYNNYFPYSEYSDTVSGSYDETMLTTYHKFDVGSVKYMSVNLDFGPTEEELAWANELIAANPDRNVIITTHGYLQDDGTYITTEEDGDLLNSGGLGGDAIWEKLVSQHENIVLVLCGHDDSRAIVKAERTGINGNKVVELLINPQTLDLYSNSGWGLYAMLYFSEDGRDVQVRYYSAMADKPYMPENQFDITLDVVEPTAAAPAVNLTDISVNVELTGDISGQLIASLYNKNGAVYDVKFYDAAATVNVVFNNVPADSSVKCMWWDGTDTIMPIAPSGIVNMLK